LQNVTKSDKKTLKNLNRKHNWRKSKFTPLYLRQILCHFIYAKFTPLYRMLPAFVCKYYQLATVKYLQL